MQQTTYGEIHKKIKTEVFGKKKVNTFLEQNRDYYDSLKIEGSCLYSNNLSLTSDHSLNYLMVVL